MTLPPANEVAHVKYSHMTWTKGHIHAGGDFFACRLITAADNPQGQGRVISNTLQAGITLYDGCSIDQPSAMHDETFVVLGGIVRISTGENYSRKIEARPGDVLWLPKGASWRFEGERGSIFYVVYPGDVRKRTPFVPTAGALPQAKHHKPQEMAFEKAGEVASGHWSRCRLVPAEVSKTIGVSIETFDKGSVEKTFEGDSALVVLQGPLRIFTGDNFSRIIDATFSDVVYVPKGSRVKFEGNAARIYVVNVGAQ